MLDISFYQQLRCQQLHHIRMSVKAVRHRIWSLYAIRLYTDVRHQILVRLSIKVFATDIKATVSLFTWFETNVYSVNTIWTSKTCAWSINLSKFDRKLEYSFQNVDIYIDINYDCGYCSCCFSLFIWDNWCSNFNRYHL